MGESVRPDEHRRGGAIKEVSPGTGTTGTLLTALEISPIDAFSVP
jgi:hypothetical protein